MRHLKLLSLLSISSLVLLLGGCSGSNSGGGGGGNSSSGSQTTTVYMTGTAGSASTSSAEVWQLVSGSSTAVATALPSPSGLSYAEATAVAVSGSNVYVAGWASSYIDSPHAAYWVNGSVGTLPNPISTVQDTDATGIAVSGSDVYVAGYAYDPDFSAYYLAPVYWVNGVAEILPLPSGTEGTPYATGIAVSGSDVYVAGYAIDTMSSSFIATYWANGTGATLPLFNGPSLPGGALNYSDESYATGIAVSGSDVYVAGYGYSTYSTNAAYWVNGVAETVPYPSGTTSATAYAIAVSGSDVYVAGDASDTSNEYTAAYWVNGAAATVPLPSGATGAAAYAIAVSTR